jgi:AAA15 family ATPase/GTPase
MSDTFFKNIHISNFKSLKDVTLSDCKRINLLIGKPNVGKSNILEAIGLFSLPYFGYNNNKKLTQFIRLENLAELFFDGSIDEKITIRIDDDSYYSIAYNEQLGLVDIYINSNNYYDADYESSLKNDKNSSLLYYSCSILVDNELNIESTFPDFSNELYQIDPSIKFKNYPYPPKVKLYKFSQDCIFRKTELLTRYLLPPFGINLPDIIQYHKELKTDLSQIFSEYGFKLLFDKTNNTLRIMKTLKDDNTMISFPYSSIADTLQRVIFFKTAIASNKDSILLFEEPEAHCFPPYISYFTREVIYSETNQFFIATHSPYVLNDFLEYKRDDVAIFMTDFKEGETVINRLTDDEVNEVYQCGIDLFFNHERFRK